MNRKSSIPIADEPKKGRATSSWIRFRLGFVYVGICLSFAVIVCRLVQLQVLPNSELDTLAQKQFEKTGTTAPYRLSIFDRNREELAVSIPSTSVFARPKMILARKHTARILAKHLGETPEHWLKRLDPQKSFVWIQRQISETLGSEIAKENLPGIYTESENKRFYPNGPLAASVVGFTDVDGNGISGLEFGLNEELLQKGNRFPLPRDGKGNPSYIDKKYFRADDGKTGVYVTLDRRIQYVVDEELERAMPEIGAKNIMAVVMDPFTGEILAMGQRPSFDPNHMAGTRPELFTNKHVSSLYEPGSTMKVLMSAEAIQQGLLSRHSPINCENGNFKIGNIKIHEAEASHKYGVIPMEKVIQVSSNIGAIKIAQALGISRVRAVLEKFGLTRKTGVHLPGEGSGVAKNDKFWKPITLATVGFGQGISVTPLQMVAAYAPFANGGYLIRPRILLRENISKDELEVRRVLTPSTVQVMRDILRGVTESGTGTLARIPGINVAGKTGTAQKYEPGVGYGGKKYFSSFIGYLPAEQPELLVGVMVDEPNKLFYGGLVAAPLFRRIAERSLQILGRTPKLALNQSVGKPPEIPTEHEIAIEENAQGKKIMPDLKELSVRAALHALGPYVDDLQIVGSGYLVAQSPAAGTAFDSHTHVTLNFDTKTLK